MTASLASANKTGVGVPAASPSLGNISALERKGTFQGGDNVRSALRFNDLGKSLIKHWCATWLMASLGTCSSCDYWEPRGGVSLTGIRKGKLSTLN